MKIRAIFPDRGESARKMKRNRKTFNNVCNFTARNVYYDVTTYLSMINSSRMYIYTEVANEVGTNLVVCAT